ncbi:MAG: molybdopterin-guanine dinucleotide biosynthesis protein MobB [Escherichia coli]|nr:molybdopterin-guanine dinucleotide biosynthesis protein MobB [Escherichia coli]
MAGKTMIPLLAFAAWSGTGKTTLLKQLIPALCARGIRPGLIKHTHHDMDVDKPGKDSYELRKAGAAQTIVASQQRWALMTETPDEEELDLQFLASRMDTSKLDLILVPLNLDVALLDINDVEGLADFVVEWMQKQNG